MSTPDDLNKDRPLTSAERQARVMSDALKKAVDRYAERVKAVNAILARATTRTAGGTLSKGDRRLLKSLRIASW